jgi:hypothetical protein
MNPDDIRPHTDQNESNTKVQDYFSARIVLHEIRGDLYQYICTPQRRKSLKAKISEKLSGLKSLTSTHIFLGLDKTDTNTIQDFSKLLTQYEELLDDALEAINFGKEQQIIESLDNGPLQHTHLKMNEYLSMGTKDTQTAQSVSHDETLQAQISALFTIIEIIGAVAVLFPGVFVSIGVPATFAKSLTMLNQVQKIYPGVQLALDRKNEIMILAGTMAAFAGGMHKNATHLLQQMAKDENIQNITVVDESGKTISASELVQYALDIETDHDILHQTILEREQKKSQTGQSPPLSADPDMLQKLIRLMETVTNPVGESLKNVDKIAQQNIQARLEDASRGKEFIFQIPMTLSDVGTSFGADISARMREFAKKVNSITEKEITDNKKF